MITSTTARDPFDNFPCFSRNYIGKLEKYGEEQERYYGKKKELIERLERLYDVKLGRYVRHLCGEIILFFPHKTGLTGPGVEQFQWQAIYFEEDAPYDGLTCLTPYVDADADFYVLHRLFHACGLDLGKEAIRLNDIHGRDLMNRLYRNFSDNKLYVYYYGRLYVANATHNDSLSLSSVRRR